MNENIHYLILGTIIILATFIGTLILLFVFIPSIVRKNAARKYDATRKRFKENE